MICWIKGKGRKEKVSFLLIGLAFERCGACIVLKKCWKIITKIWEKPETGIPGQETGK